MGNDIVSAFRVVPEPGFAETVLVAVFLMILLVAVKERAASSTEEKTDD